MKKLFTMMIAFSFLLAGCDKDMESLGVDNDLLKSAGTEFEMPNIFDAEGKYCDQVNGVGLVGTQMEVWMGVGNQNAGAKVGYVTFVDEDEDGTGTVIIDLNTAGMWPYYASEVHIHFADAQEDIPQTKNGNPIPGLFEYNIPLDPFQTNIEVKNVVFKEYGAIHLPIEYKGGVEGFALYLPDEPVKIIYTYPGVTSYAELEIFGDNAGDLAGTYENWCVDTDIPFAPGKVYDALLYSSYDAPGGIVSYPENFPLINYLVNNYAVGDQVQPMDDCDKPTEGRDLELITIGDIQMAIWDLIDGGTRPVPSVWSQERVNAIVCEVEANGVGFIPGCDERIVFLVVPVDPELGLQLIVGQPTISSVPVPCEDVGETAWGDGYWGATFKGKQWGTWFMYDADCTPED